MLLDHRDELLAVLPGRGLSQAKGALVTLQRRGLGRVETRVLAFA